MGIESVRQSDRAPEFRDCRIQIGSDGWCGHSAAGDAATQTGSDGLLVGWRTLHGTHSPLDDVQLDVSVSGIIDRNYVIKGRDGRHYLDNIIVPLPAVIDPDQQPGQLAPSGDVLQVDPDVEHLLEVVRNDTREKYPRPDSYVQTLTTRITNTLQGRMICLSARSLAIFHGTFPCVP